MPKRITIQRMTGVMHCTYAFLFDIAGENPLATPESRKAIGDKILRTYFGEHPIPKTAECFVERQNPYVARSMNSIYDAHIVWNEPDVETERMIRLPPTEDKSCPST